MLDDVELRARELIRTCSMQLGRRGEELGAQVRSLTLNTHTKSILYLTIVAALLSYTLRIYLTRRHLRHQVSRPSTPTTPSLEKASSKPFTSINRDFGKWTPSSFVMPKPEPYLDWSITDTAPLPYRPFRYGPKYNVTMGLRIAKHVD